MSSFLTVSCVIVVAVIVFLAISASRNAIKEKKQLPGGIGDRKMYHELRSQLFTVTCDQLKIDLPPEGETAFGVIFEYATPEGTATISSFATGDASMYTSSGGGIIGGATHEQIKRAAIDLVSISQKFFEKMPVADNWDTPKAGDMKFFIRTNRRIYSFEANEQEIINERSSWHELFIKENNVITQLHSYN